MSDLNPCHPFHEESSVLPITKNIKVLSVSNAVAAGTSDSNATAVDMAGFNSVAFIVCLGAIVSGGVQSIKVQQSDDNSTFADLEASGFTIADTDDNGVVLVEVMRPEKRYVRVVTKRATQNTTIDRVIALQGNAIGPLPLTVTTLGNEVLVTPAEGTA